MRWSVYNGHEQLNEISEKPEHGRVQYSDDRSDSKICYNTSSENVPVLL